MTRKLLPQGVYQARCQHVVFSDSEQCYKRTFIIEKGVYAGVIAHDRVYMLTKDGRQNAYAAQKINQEAAALGIFNAEGMSIPMVRMRLIHALTDHELMINVTHREWRGEKTPQAEVVDIVTEDAA